MSRTRGKDNERDHSNGPDSLDDSAYNSAESTNGSDYMDADAFDAEEVDQAYEEMGGFDRHIDRGVGAEYGTFDAAKVLNTGAQEGSGLARAIEMQLQEFVLQRGDIVRLRMALMILQRKITLRCRHNCQMAKPRDCKKSSWTGCQSC